MWFEWQAVFPAVQAAVESIHKRRSSTAERLGRYSRGQSSTRRRRCAGSASLARQRRSIIRSLEPPVGGCVGVEPPVQRRPRCRVPTSRPSSRVQMRSACSWVRSYFSAIPSPYKTPAKASILNCAGTQATQATGVLG